MLAHGHLHMVSVLFRSFLKESLPFFTDYYIEKIVIAIPPNILYGNSLKLCMLAYYHMEICILFWQVDGTNFGVFPLWICHNKDRSCLCAGNSYILNMLYFRFDMYILSTTYRFHIASSRYLSLNMEHMFLHQKQPCLTLVLVLGVLNQNIYIVGLAITMYSSLSYVNFLHFNLLPVTSCLFRS